MITSKVCLIVEGNLLQGHTELFVSCAGWCLPTIIKRVEYLAICSVRYTLVTAASCIVNTNYEIVTQLRIHGASWKTKLMAVHDAVG